MNDPKTVISNLAKRWLAQYGETLGTEEIRRHLSRMLSELQKREIEQVFANWSGEQLMSAIEATFDLDDGSGVVRTKELAKGLCPPSEPLGDTEYLPIADGWEQKVADLPFDREPDLMLGDTPVYASDMVSRPIAIVSKRRGRPPGAKNKGKK